MGLMGRGGSSKAGTAAAATTTAEGGTAAGIVEKHREEEKEIIRFAKRLAANEKRDRDQALKRLEAWMTKHKQLAEKDLLKIWKGLFYCMWMSDKAQVQQELGVAISRLVHCFGKDLGRAHLFVTTFYRTVRREWTGLDQHRLDKFYSFMRSMLRECLLFAQKRRWSAEALAAVVLPLDAEVLVQPWPNGLRLHLCDLILPELNRVGGDKLTTAQALAVLQPFLVAMAASTDRVVAERARARVLLDWVAAKKAAQQGDEDDEEEEGEKETGAFLPSVDMKALQATVFELASAADTRERYRAGLYEAHKAFQGLTGQKRADARKAHAVPLPTLEEEEEERVASAKAGKASEDAMEEAEEEDDDEDTPFAEPPAKKGSSPKKRKAEAEVAKAVEEPTKKKEKKGAEAKAKKTTAAAAAVVMPKMMPETPLGVEMDKLTGLSKAQKKKVKKLKPKGDDAAVQKPSAPKESQTPVASCSAAKESSTKQQAAKTATGLEQGTKRKKAEAPTKEEAAATRKTSSSSSKKKKVEQEVAVPKTQQAEDKKTKKSSSSTTTAAATVKPAAATEPEFIAAKTFAGCKNGYAFKKGPKGVGYYFDPVQRGGGRVAAAGGGGSGSKKVRWGRVQVKVFNKHASPAEGKGNTVSFMGNEKKGGRQGGGRGGFAGGRGKQQNVFHTRR